MPPSEGVCLSCGSLATAVAESTSRYADLLITCSTENQTVNQEVPMIGEKIVERHDRSSESLSMN
jgi:hypothetical protein